LDKHLKKLKEPQVNKIARFLEIRGDIESAFEIVTDPGMKFDYSVKLGNIAEATKLAE